MLNNEYGVTLAEKEVIEVTLNEQLPGTDGNGIASIVAVPVAGGQNVTINYTYPGMDPVELFLPNGEQGPTGKGIAGISKVSTVGLVDTYRITYTDATTTDFTVVNSDNLAAGTDYLTPEAIAEAYQVKKAETELYVNQGEKDGWNSKAEGNHTHADLHAPHSDDQDLSGLVPKTTTINGKELSGNISLDYSDVGASASGHTHTDLHTHSNKTALDNVSGTNTGDETGSTIKTKLGITTLSGSNTGDQDLSGLVPYTGATSDVDLGSHSINASDITLPVLTNLISNGDFSNGATGWGVIGGGISASVNTLTITGNGTSASPRSYHTTDIDCVAGDKYYARARVRKANAYDNLYTSLRFTSSSGDVVSIKSVINPQQGVWHTLSGNVTVTNQVGKARLFVYQTHTTAEETLNKSTDVQFALLINLTATFGAGNEPSATEMDGLLSYYPNSWFEGANSITDLLLNLVAKKRDKDNVLFDQTYEAVWKTGTPTADASTDTITLAGHGLANGDPVEFDNGTGALPSGISPYTDDAVVGAYYNVINATTDTFQITATVGGTTPVDITSAGTNGWKVRLATIALSGVPLDFTSANECDVFIMMKCAKKTTIAMNMYFRLNGAATGYRYFSPVTASFAGDALLIFPSITSKYSAYVIKLNIKKITDTMYAITTNANGQQTDNRSTATALTDTRGAYVITPIIASTFLLSSSDSTKMVIRSGTRVVVVRRS